jgi:hypothetical protein
MRVRGSILPRVRGDQGSGQVGAARHTPFQTGSMKLLDAFLTSYWSVP